MAKMKDKILDKIEKQNIEPTPKSYFDWMERIKWMLIGIFSVFSMAFILFLIDDAVEMFSYGPGVFAGRWIGLILPPLLWMAVISAAIFFVVREFRKTNTGYKYSVKFLLGIGLLLFLIAPAIFRGIGFGPGMHSAFVDHMPFVEDYVYDRRSWNNPDDGKLAGEIGKILNGRFELKEPSGKIWQVEYGSNNGKMPNIPLIAGEKVRVIGKKIGDSDFKAERVIPWFGRGGMMRGGMMERGMMRHPEGGSYPYGKDGMMRQQVPFTGTYR